MKHSGFGCVWGGIGEFEETKMGVGGGLEEKTRWVVREQVG